MLYPPAPGQSVLKLTRSPGGPTFTPWVAPPPRSAPRRRAQGQHGAREGGGGPGAGAGAAAGHTAHWSVPTPATCSSAPQRACAHPVRPSGKGQRL